jgi:cytoskeletal protein RodZ
MRVHSELALAFGRELQLERERQGISLEAIAESTKVPHRHLQALELDQLDLLPGGIFAKGIVRSYCRHLGLDEQEWLQRFPSVFQQDATPEWAEFAENVSRNRTPQAGAMRVRWLGVLLMAAALGVLSWVAWQYVVQPQVVGRAVDAKAASGHVDR